MKANAFLCWFVAGALSICTLGSPSWAADEPKKGSDPMTESLKPLSGDEFEKRYLQEMISHHKAGIDMAKLVHQKAKHGELHGFATKITEEQSREIDQMTGWLKEWHNAAPDPNAMPAEARAKMKADMEKLEKAEGAEFDRLFLQLMSTHHKGAISMFALVPEKTKREALISSAKKGASMQGAEVEQMQKWQADWFKH